MFELSHRLIGIYKTANATQSRFSWVCTFDILTDALKVSRLTTMHWLSPNHRLRLHESLSFPFFHGLSWLNFMYDGNIIVYYVYVYIAKGTLLQS